MQDSRLRVLSTLILSLSAFSSVIGAVFVFMWWLLFSKRQRSLPSIKIFFGFFFLAAAVSLLMEARGLPGSSYFIRMTVILLIAGWAYTEISSADMLNVMTWAFGNKTGFELGLIAGISLNRIKQISDDYSKTKMAFTIKNPKFQWKEFIPVIGNILIWSLKESSEQGKILALRGYTRGGSMLPTFGKSKRDAIPAFFSIAIFSFSFFYLVTYL